MICGYLYMPNVLVKNYPWSDESLYHSWKALSVGNHKVAGSSYVTVKKGGWVSWVSRRGSCHFCVNWFTI